MEKEERIKRNLKQNGSQECVLIRNEKEGTEIQLVSINSTIEELINSAFIIKNNFFDTKQVERSYIGWFILIIV